MINKVTLLGRVGKDPEIKQFENGSIANFTIATDDSYKDKSGQKVERTDWHNITIGSAGLVDVVSKYVKKGDLIYVEGKVKTREYEKDGVKRYTTEIRVETLKMMPKSNIENNGARIENTSTNNTNSTPAQAENFISEVNQVDDDLPF